MMMMMMMIVKNSNNNDNNNNINNNDDDDDDDDNNNNNNNNKNPCVKSVQVLSLFLYIIFPNSVQIHETRSRKNTEFRDTLLMRGKSLK